MHQPSKNNSPDRRDFLKTTASATVAAAAVAGFHTSVSAEEVSDSANEAIRVGIMGLNGRGSSLAQTFLGRPNVNVVHLCDVDSRAIDKGKAAVASKQKEVPKSDGDFRKILDNKEVDVLICAAPNHWHAPATILGCAAGKHVYVEKPCSHTPWEGEMAVAAARKHDRVVQHGTQRRNSPLHVEAVKKVHDGAIGKPMFARAWYKNRRPSIGTGKTVDVPAWLDFKLWQGPVTENDYKDNLIHYNWHWHWHWGNGELGNNGVHALDVARWGMQAEFPTRVTSAGGRYRWDDDQETADTHMVTFEYGDEKMITWEGLSWSPFDATDSQFGVSFHGDEGTLLLLDSKYTLYDMKNKVIEEQTGGVTQNEHVDDFLSCIRSGERPNADIEIAHRSALLCHLGNISLREGRALNTDPKNGHIIGDEAAAARWTKEYRDGWKPTV